MMVDARCMIQDIMMRDTMIHDLVSRSMSTRMSHSTADGVLHVECYAEHSTRRGVQPHTTHHANGGAGYRRYTIP